MMQGTRPLKGKRKRWYLVCYDIRDNRRLQRVHRCLRRRALAMQYSVFLLQCRDEQLTELREALRRLADPREDDIRIYPVRAPGTLWMSGRQGEALAALYPVADDGSRERRKDNWLVALGRLFMRKGT